MSEVAEDNRFAVTLPLIKAWTDEKGQMWVEGVASSTSLDRQRERMTKNAIAKMQQFAGIDLLPSHGAGPLEELGTVKECWVDNDSFRVRAQLEEMSPRAVRLFKRLAEGRQYGLSVGGRVTEAYWDFDQEAGERVKYIDDVVLDHVAVCRPQQAANPDTYLAVLAKDDPDVIFIATKACILSKLMPDISKAADGKCLVMSVQNGIGTEDEITKYF